MSAITFKIVTSRCFGITLKIITSQWSKTLLLHQGGGKFLLCRVESTGAAQESEQEDAQRRRARDAGPPHDPLLLGRMAPSHRAMQLHPSRNRCAWWPSSRTSSIGKTCSKRDAGNMVSPFWRGRLHLMTAAQQLHPSRAPGFFLVRTTKKITRILLAVVPPGFTRRNYGGGPDPYPFTRILLVVEGIKWIAGCEEQKPSAYKIYSLHHGWSLEELCVLPVPSCENAVQDSWLHSSIKIQYKIPD